MTLCATRNDLKCHLNLSDVHATGCEIRTRNSGGSEGFEAEGSTQRIGPVVKIIASIHTINYTRFGFTLARNHRKTTFGRKTARAVSSERAAVANSPEQKSAVAAP